MSGDEEPSVGKLFSEAFVDKNLVEFVECRTQYEAMTPDQLVDELGFLFSKPVMSIPFGFTNDRYYAFFTGLVHCATNYRNLGRDDRARLVNMAIDVQGYIRARMKGMLDMRGEQDT